VEHVSQHRTETFKRIRGGGQSAGQSISARLRWNAGIAALAAVTIAATPGFIGAADAGALAVREQSAHFQGSSFAGNAAGGALSSSFWNSAAIGDVGHGLQTESSYSLLLGHTEFTVLPGTTLGGAGTRAEHDRPAIIGSSYGAYRLNDRAVLGVAISAPFGLSNEVANPNWVGQLHHRSASLFTLNINPMLSYEVARGLFIGAGVQGQYAKLKFKTAAPVGLPPFPTATLEGDDIGFGFTVGLMWKPTNQTTIGLGYRSAISHTIEGDQRVLISPVTNQFKLGIDTPEMVTLSFRHAVTDRARLLGTVEWTHWDRLNVHPVTVGPATIANFDFRYSDGWFFSLGGEYDYSRNLTLRTGIAYEISPVDDPSKRLPQVADADRIWLSAGMSYKLTDATTLDFAYTHIFIEDSTLSRRPAAVALAGFNLNAAVESSVDILSVGVKMKFGGHQPLK